MAKSGTLPVGRYFLGLAAILVALYAIVFWPGQRHTPKLGLDLVGGTQVIFTAHTVDGGAPSSSAMNQAKQIMEERVNSSGVTEATVVIQGSNQIVISIPGNTDVDPRSLGATAKLNMRGLVAPPAPVSCTAASTSSSSSASPNSSATPTSSASTPAAANPSGDSHDAKLLTPRGKKATSTATPKATPSNTPTPTASASTAPPQPCTATPFTALEKSGLKIPTSEAAFEKLTSAQQSEISAALANFDCSSAQDEHDIATSYYIACDYGANVGQQLAFLLGTVIVDGQQISGASAVAPNISQGITDYEVQLKMKASAQKAWAEYTAAHNVGGVAPTTSITSCGSAATPCADYVGFTLDGRVISNPYNNSAINQSTTEISGNFTPKTADQLAQQLKFGALPLNFKADTAQTVSATLGSSQLKAGLLAGGIGLILVVIYSLIYYRALGLVTISSLIVSGGLVYGSLVMLGEQIGFTLSLAGIAGFIVAVGITADSFVVFFERIKDEVHEGRSVRVAIPRAWVRARRTILSADTVSFLAAAILYYFAAGDVKGFAFTLGLSTILDLIVVFLFTHPLISLLSRNKAFGSGRYTGLSHVREGGLVYEDAAPVRTAGARRAETPREDEPEAAPTLAGSAVATLTNDEVDDEVGDGADTGPDEDEEPDEPTEPSERRHTTPEPGSAAERAAARRARLREEGES